MSLGIQINCDAIMDEYGSTCARRWYYNTTDLNEVHRLAAADYWLLDSTDRALCPLHSGIRPPRLKLDLDGHTGVVTPFPPTRTV